MTSKIVVFGSCSVDFTAYAPRLPNPGETLHGHKFTTSNGGKGANQCVAAALLSGDVAMVARIGDDKWGSDYVNHMRNLGVDTTYMLTTADRGTGIAQIVVSDSGENQIVIVTGANGSLSAQDARAAESIIGNASVLVCQLETPIEATIEAFRLCKGIKILNAAPAVEKLSEELLSLTTILCVNETEASILTGKPVNDLEEVSLAIGDLLKLGCKTVIVTLGERGAAFATSDDPRPFRVSSEKVTAVDTTGAGDAFIGSLAALLASDRGLPLKDMIGACCRAAAASVTKEGTQTSFVESRTGLPVRDCAADPL